MSAATRKKWTRAAVEALGPTTTVPTTASIFDVSAETIYGRVRDGTWTATRVLRIGRVIRIPTLDIIRLLFDPDAGAAGAFPDEVQPHHHAENVQVRGGESGRQSQSQCGCRFEESGAVVPLRATS